MTLDQSQLLGIQAAPPRVNELRRFIRIFFGRKLVLFGMVVIAVFFILAVFAPQIAPYGPYKQDLAHTLAPPSWQHLLGTDNFGRDTLSRIIYGSRIALMVGVIAVGIAAGAGMILGLIAGYFGGWRNTLIMRFMDALMAFPMILLALLLTSLLGGGLVNVMVALGIALMPGYARIMCGQVLSIRENDYVLAGQAIGATNFRIMTRHIFPNSLPPILVMVTLMMGQTILAEAGLSYLGIGVELPTATWGGMINEGYQYLLSKPILSFAPGIAIMLVVFSFNMIGDGLRDALDPRLRGVL
jgi:ABC-type dipeptide/oligopeptide/nickel transport system permease subunit